jgi:F-type H+-transporting ATPase subunit a
MKTLLFAGILALAAPAVAAELAEDSEAHQGVRHAVGHGAAREASCEEILAAAGEGHEGEPSLSEVVFHHVSDGTTVSVESPFSHGELSFDFKRLECRLLGWNGVVTWNGKPVTVAGMTVDLTPTKHTFWMWVAGLLLILMFAVAAPKKEALVPKGFGLMLEMMVLFVRDEIARKTIPGKDADRYVPYLLNAFFFILVMNFAGLIPYGAAATSNVSVTMGLALFTFVITQAAGIRAAGLGGYLRHLTGGVHWLLWPIMIPVEFLGLFTKPFALTVRLFANMMAGHIVIYFLLGLIFILKTAYVAPVSVAFAFGIYLLEIFVALVQAFIFTMLSSLFIGFGVAMHHGHEAGHEAAAHH